MVMSMQLSTNPQRSKNMQAVKSKGTDIELLLRKALWHKGIHYRKNIKVLDCHPDIVLTKYKIAIFCDGDFWHGKENPEIIKTHKTFCVEKIKRNMERDLENTIELRDNNWLVLRFCESDIKKHLDNCVNEVLKSIELRRQHKGCQHHLLKD